MTELPDRIGRYEVLNLLGQGGMGLLYLARDPVIDRHVALKLLKVDNDDLRRRFVREARSAGRLQHPNIVTVYDVGDHDGELFIAMEYIDGDTLATLIRDGVPFSTTRKLEMLDQLADGLGFAHQRNIIHRDIKPANLMLTRGGLLKVLDFGIARLAHRQSQALTVAGANVIGTPAYMAPEQLEGGLVDHRSDIFAVGLVMYELLSGKRAFVGATTADVLSNVLRAEPVPLEQVAPHIEPALAKCVARALARQPEDRYQDLQELRHDLGRVRRRAEFESGAFDATVVVQRPTPPAPTAPVAPLASPAAPVAPAAAVAASAGQVASITASTTWPARPADIDDEGVALRHLTTEASRGSRPIAVPLDVDETIIAPVQAPPPPPSPSPPLPPREAVASHASADAPTAVVPAYVPPVPDEARKNGATTSPAAAPTPAHRRRSVVPALIAVGVLVLLCAAAAIGALWWARNQLLDRFGPAADGASAEASALPSSERDPGASDIADGAVPSRSSTEDDAAASAAASNTAVPENVLQEPLPAGPVASSSRTGSGAPPAPSTPRAAATAGAVATAPRPSAGSPVGRAGADDRVPTTTAPPDAGVIAVDRSTPTGNATDGAAEGAARPVPAEADAARDEAVRLVRAYVAARNSASADGLRRVWPTVNEVELRRMTGDYAAPLTLTHCDVDPASGGRLRAHCRFTQPGSTDFSQGTSLNIRRQLVFDLERQANGGWIIAKVTG